MNRNVIKIDGPVGLFLVRHDPEPPNTPTYEIHLAGQRAMLDFVELDELADMIDAIRGHDRGKLWGGDAVRDDT